MSRLRKDGFFHAAGQGETGIGEGGWPRLPLFRLCRAGLKPGGAGR